MRCGNLRLVPAAEIWGPLFYQICSVSHLHLIPVIYVFKLTPWRIVLSWNNLDRRTNRKQIGLVWVLLLKFQSFTVFFLTFASLPLQSSPCLGSQGTLCPLGMDRRFSSSVDEMGREKKSERENVGSNVRKSRVSQPGNYRLRDISITHTNTRARAFTHMHTHIKHASHMSTQFNYNIHHFPKFRMHTFATCHSVAAHTHTLAHWHTHLGRAGGFPITPSCVQSSKMLLSPMFSGFDESNTLRSDPFNLLTKALMDGLHTLTHTRACARTHTNPKWACLL